MPYTPAHRLRTRKRIVDSARRLFNQHGFDGVSIQQIMEGAGLTHGGFYRHFAGKSELYAEVMACFFTDPEWKNGWEGVALDAEAADAGAQIVRAYLSDAHLDAGEAACPMVALPSDAARGGEAARAAYQRAFDAMVRALERGAAGDDGRPPRQTALAIAALCIGGMVIARASADREFAHEVRAAARDVALDLGSQEA